MRARHDEFKSWSGFEACHQGHVLVEDNDYRLRRFGLRDSFAAVLRFFKRIDADVVKKEVPDALADRFAVIDNEDGGHLAGFFRRTQALRQSGKYLRRTPDARLPRVMTAVSAVTPVQLLSF